jgi:hypothetical protein
MALLTSYVLARYRFPGRSVIYYALISTMFLPGGAATLVILFFLIKDLGLFNSLWALVLVGATLTAMKSQNTNLKREMLLGDRLTITTIVITATPINKPRIQTTKETIISSNINKVIMLEIEGVITNNNKEEVVETKDTVSPHITMKTRLIPKFCQL